MGSRHQSERCTTFRKVARAPLLGNTITRNVNYLQESLGHYFCVLGTKFDSVIDRLYPHYAYVSFRISCLRFTRNL